MSPVVPLSLSSNGPNVSKSVRLEASLASVVTVWVEVHNGWNAISGLNPGEAGAVYELLSCKTRPGRAVLETESAELGFHSGGGAKGPARSALALVFNLGHLNLAGWVVGGGVGDGCGWSGAVRGEGIRTFVLLNGLKSLLSFGHEVFGLELVVSHMRKLVESYCICF